MSPNMLRCSAHVNQVHVCFVGSTTNDGKQGWFLRGDEKYALLLMKVPLFLFKNGWVQVIRHFFLYSYSSRGIIFLLGSTLYWTKKHICETE